MQDLARNTTRQDNDDGKAWLATGLSLAGALAMTSCCILPLVLVSLGVTGVFIGQMASFYQYKWITFAVSAAFLGWGFYKAYAPVKCADGTCARPMNRTVMRAFLWLAAAIMAIAILFPYVAPSLLTF